MIVSTQDDMVRLSGALVKNQWLTIKAAANLLLVEHPEGIIIDCSELENVSEDGAKTFLEAMKDIQAVGARIVVCNLPENVMQVIRSVPGVRSQLPLASSMEEARASLRLSSLARPSDADASAQAEGLLIPLMPGLDAMYSVLIASKISRELRQPLHLVYLMQVARHLPMGTPLPEEEEKAHQMMEVASQEAKRLNVPSDAHLERVRDAQEGILHAIKSYKTSWVILGAYPQNVGNDEFMELVSALLHRAPCNVMVARRELEVSQDHSQERGDTIPEAVPVAGGRSRRRSFRGTSEEE
jgi:anti-anti-sigma regulatory factor